MTGGSSFERAWVKGSKSNCVELDIVSMASLIVYLWIAASVVKTNKDMFPQHLELPSGLGIFGAGTKLLFPQSLQETLANWPDPKEHPQELEQMEKEQKELMLSCAMLRRLLGLRFVESHAGAEMI